MRQQRGPVPFQQICAVFSPTISFSPSVTHFHSIFPPPPHVPLSPFRTTNSLLSLHLRFITLCTAGSQADSSCAWGRTDFSKRLCFHIRACCLPPYNTGHRACIMHSTVCFLAFFLSITVFPFLVCQLSFSHWCFHTHVHSFADTYHSFLYFLTPTLPKKKKKHNSLYIFYILLICQSCVV